MHNVYIIDDDENLKNKLNEEFQRDGNYKFKQIKTEDIDVALKDYITEKNRKSPI